MPVEAKQVPEEDLEKVEKCAAGRKKKSAAQVSKAEKPKFKRRRLSKEETEMMFAEFAKDPNWDKKKWQEMAQRLGVPERMVYKWHYDQKRKLFDE